MSNKYKRDLKEKAKKFNGYADETIKLIDLQEPINLTCRNDALDLLDLLESDWSVSIEEPLDALRRFIEALPEAKEGAA